MRTLASKICNAGMLEANIIFWSEFIVGHGAGMFRPLHRLRFFHQVRSDAGFCLFAAFQPCKVRCAELYFTVIRAPSATEQAATAKDCLASRGPVRRTTVKHPG